MKTNFILLLLFFAITANAQGRRDKQGAINAQYGYIMDKDSLTGGFMAKAGYSRVMGDKGFLGKVEGFYQDYKITYLDNQILPYQKYGLSVSAGYSYEALSPVFLNAWIGAYGAFEKANDGNQNDPKFNAAIPSKVSGISYGITGSAEVEVMITPKLSFLADYTQFYDLKSKFSKSNYAFFGGLKYYIN